MRKAIALVATIVSVAAFGDDMTQACAGNAPSATEYRNNPKLHADNFCALWLHERSKALRRLSQSVKTNRVINDPNRWYFNPKNHPNAEPIQLRRPWMEGLQVKFIDRPYAGGTDGKLVCEENDGEDANCVDIWIYQSQKTLVMFGDPVTGLNSGEVDSDDLLIEDDGKNGYHQFILKRTFRNASEAKVCVEAILDRMERRHYRHPSVESACGSTFKCQWLKRKEDKIRSCRIERE